LLDKTKTPQNTGWAAVLNTASKKIIDSTNRASPEGKPD